MTLMECPECRHEVSAAAVACPKCAHPLKYAVTIEQTGKKWKKLQLYSVAVLAVSAFLFVGGGSSGNQGTITLGVVFATLGLGMYFYARIATWWHHK